MFVDYDEINLMSARQLLELQQLSSMVSEKRLESDIDLALQLVLKSIEEGHADDDADKLFDLIFLDFDNP